MWRRHLPLLLVTEGFIYQLDEANERHTRSLRRYQHPSSPQPTRTPRDSADGRATHFQRTNATATNNGQPRKLSNHAHPSHQSNGSSTQALPFEDVDRHLSPPQASQVFTKGYHPPPPQASRVPPQSCHPPLRGAAAGSPDPFAPLKSLLHQRGVLTMAICRELVSGLEYWDLERRLCAAVEGSVALDPQPHTLGQGRGRGQGQGQGQGRGQGQGQGKGHFHGSGEDGDDGGHENADGGDNGGRDDADDGDDGGSNGGSGGGGGGGGECHAPCVRAAGPIDPADVERAISLKSFDYRVLNLLLHELVSRDREEEEAVAREEEEEIASPAACLGGRDDAGGEGTATGTVPLKWPRKQPLSPRQEQPPLPLNPDYLAFLRASETLVEIADDLFDYEDDVQRGSFNVLRMLTHAACLGPEGGCRRLAGMISAAEAAYASSGERLPPGLRARFEARNEEAVARGMGLGMARGIEMDEGGVFEGDHTTEGRTVTGGKWVGDPMSDGKGKGEEKGEGIGEEEGEGKGQKKGKGQGDRGWALGTWSFPPVITDERAFRAGCDGDENKDEGALGGFTFAWQRRQQDMGRQQGAVNN
eukprot:jgi/Mesvir1/13111/Mv06090-RA.1